MISDSPTTIEPDAQLDRRLRQGVEDVRAGRDEQHHVPAVALRDRHDPREQRLLVVGEDLLIVQPLRAAAPAASSRTVITTMSRASDVRLDEHPVELRERVVVADGHQHAARPAAERLGVDLLFGVSWK